MWQDQINRKRENELHLPIVLNAENMFGTGTLSPLYYNIYFAAHERLQYI